MLNIIVAHKGEAQPFIQHYNLLPKISNTNKSYYSNHNIQLIITGGGARNCEYSLKKHLDWLPTNDWLNFGTAGSREFPVGTLLQISEIKVNATKIIIPKTPFTLNLPTSKLTTVVKAEQEFKDNGVYDMESASIIKTLNQHNPDLPLTIIKIISDGPGELLSDTKSTKQRFIQLIQDNTAAVTAIRDFLLYKRKN